jgi:hypothetical protein
MSIYAIRMDYEKYQELTLTYDDYFDNVPVEREYTFDQIESFFSYNLALSDWWKTIETSFEPAERRTSAVIPDICWWHGSVLALSLDAKNKLEKYIGSLGEFLPITVAGDQFYLFNCFELGIHDEINSKHRKIDGEIIGVDRISFNEADVKNKLLFKTKFDNCGTIYCTDKFKDLITSLNLKGLVFSSDLNWEDFR